MSQQPIQHDVSFIGKSLSDARIWWNHVRKLTDESLEHAKRMEGLSLFSMDDDDLKREVNLAIHSRRQQIQKLNLAYDERLARNHGKLLILTPDASLFDGMSQDETQGIVDLFDRPASQFWLGYYPASKVWEENPLPYCALISWIPDELIEVVSRGIDVNATNCFDWIDSDFWKDNTTAKDLGHLTQ